MHTRMWSRWHSDCSSTPGRWQARFHNKDIGDCLRLGRFKASKVRWSFWARVQSSSPRSSSAERVDELGEDSTCAPCGRYMQIQPSAVSSHIPSRRVCRTLQNSVDPQSTQIQGGCCASTLIRIAPYTTPLLWQPSSSNAVKAIGLIGLTWGLHRRWSVASLSHSICQGWGPLTKRIR